MACRYPDAISPSQLWENVLAGRRAFRRLPDERMRAADYWDPDPAAPDRFYARTAAVIVGNSLTGEFSRANVLRLRWPYVRRTVAAALATHGWSDDQLSGFLDELETAYKSPFPAIDEDSLAGGLSNTIAGRICNHFDLKGGGYTVDGACSSSLLSVATACKALVDGDLDVAVAGGVDLSIDPFEIIGFAKTGALATGEMRVYDRGSNGFWPGEGCGMVVLMREAEARPADLPVRAGISSMGFGGINTHVVLENDGPRKRAPLDSRTTALASSMQDVELLLVDGRSPQELRERLSGLVEVVPALAYAQLTDLAVTLHRELRDLPYRAAVVVASPEDAERRLRRLCEALDAGEVTLFSPDGRTLLGHVSGPGRIGYLFPGQGSGRGTGGGALRRRFAEVEQVYLAAGLPETGDMVATQVAQPRIVTGSMAGLRALSALGLEASVAVGHSLGELSALQWAGAMAEETLLRVAAVRGRTMAAHSASGTMAGIGAPAESVAALIAGVPAVIAGYNGPTQTVVAGAVDAVDRVCQKARAASLSASRLPVSHAFHSPLVAAAADAFGAQLSAETFIPLGRRVISTVTGEALPPDTDVAALLRRQITDPVLFSQALALAAKDIDLFVEVGPGRVLTGLANAATEKPAIALDTDDESLAGLLRVVGAAYVVGAAGADPALFHGRVARPLAVGTRFAFFGSPCEQAPTEGVPAAGGSRGGASGTAGTPMPVDS